MSTLAVNGKVVKSIEFVDEDIAIEENWKTIDSVSVTYVDGVTMIKTLSTKDSIKSEDFNNQSWNSVKDDPILTFEEDYYAHGHSKPFYILGDNGYLDEISLCTCSDSVISLQNSQEVHLETSGKSNILV